MENLQYLRQKPDKYLLDGCKLIYHQDRLKDFIIGKRIYPIHIDMGIHKDCNIRCVYCYGIKQKPSRLYIPEKRLLLVAKDAQRAGVKSIAIIGDGEPTLNKGLYPFVRELHNSKIDVGLATNGLELSEEEINILTNNLVWLRFNVSAYGDNYEDMHKGAGRLGGWNKFVKNVNMAVKHKGKCTIGLQVVTIPQGFKDILSLAQFAIDSGVDYIVFKQFSDPEEGIPVEFNIKKEYAQATNDLVKAENMSTENTRIIVKWSAMQDSEEITGNKNWGFKRCIDLPLLFQMSGNGKCYPCGYLFNSEEHCYGNICTDRLWNILNSKHYWSIIEKVARTPLQSLCKGQCRHCETLKFVDRLVDNFCKNGNLRESLVEMCGDEETYQMVMDNPPEHINFI